MQKSAKNSNSVVQSDNLYYVKLEDLAGNCVESRPSPSALLSVHNWGDTKTGKLDFSGIQLEPGVKSILGQGPPRAALPISRTVKVNLVELSMQGEPPRDWIIPNLPKVYYSSFTFCFTFLSTLDSPSIARGATSPEAVTSPLGATTKVGSGACLLAVSILSSS
jgi:hypothetical protein